MTFMWEADRLLAELANAVNVWLHEPGDWRAQYREVERLTREALEYLMTETPR